MNTTQKRFLWFLLACIPARLLIAWIAKKTPASELRYLGLLALLPAAGFTLIYLTGSRRTGAETFGEEIWWNDLRPIHAGMYGWFAYLAYSQNEWAYMVLFLDALIGVASFLTHHYRAGSFSRLV